MTLNEFRAWLEGFEASFTGGVPNAEQWKAIKAKIEKTATTTAVPNNRPFSPLTPPRGMWPPFDAGPRYVAPTADYVDPNQTRVVALPDGSKMMV